MAAEGCGVEVGPDGETGMGVVVDGLIPGILSSDKEQPLSSRTNRLDRQSSLRIEVLVT
jgi:hypothetical protein